MKEYKTVFRFTAGFLVSVLLVLVAAGLFYNLTNGAQRKKSEKMTAFTTAYDNVILLDNTGGVYTFDYADYTEETDHTVGPDAAGVDRSAGNIGDVWIVDVRVWNAKAP